MNIRKLVQEAYPLLQRVIKKTPLEYSSELSKKYNAEIFLKFENLQKTRSFKLRGACNKIYKLDIGDKEIVCSSAGNHAQSIAYLSNKLNFRANIFIPKTTPPQKVKRIKHYMNNDLCKITSVGQIFDECLNESLKYSSKNNSIYVHPFDDKDIIVGQGTIGYEIEQERDNMDFVICTIGGGGLISGVAGYLKESLKKKPTIIGVESENNDSMKVSIKNNSLIKLENNDYFVDGSAVKIPGKITFEFCKKYVDEYFTVSNNKVCADVIDLYEYGIVSELAGAMPISCLDFIKDRIVGKKVCCVISGGNNDVLRLPEFNKRKQIYENKLHYFVIEFFQKPGELKRFINDILNENDDIVLFEYLKKNNKDLGKVLVGINTCNVEYIVALLEMHKYNFIKINSDNILYEYLL